MAESEADVWRHIQIAREALNEMSATMTPESQDKFVKEIQTLTNMFNNLSPNIDKYFIETQINSMISEGYAIMKQESNSKIDIILQLQGKNKERIGSLRIKPHVNYNEREGTNRLVNNSNDVLAPSPLAPANPSQSMAQTAKKRGKPEERTKEELQVLIREAYKASENARKTRRKPEEKTKEELQVLIREAYKASENARKRCVKPEPEPEPEPALSSKTSNKNESRPTSPASMPSTLNSTRKRPRPASAASLPIIKEGRHTRTSLKTPANTLNLLPEPTRKRKPTNASSKPNVVPFDPFGPSVKDVALNEPGETIQRYQANLPNLQMKDNAKKTSLQNTAMTMNELLNTINRPNFNITTSKSTFKTKHMTKENINKNFKKDIDNVSLRKQFAARHTMNVSKSHPNHRKTRRGSRKHYTH